jgi:mRNA interferase MazF
MLATLVLRAGIAWGQDDGAARIADGLTVPLATLPVLKDAPTLDTVPDFKNWARPLAFQHLAGFKKKAPLETRGYLAHDAGHIYLAVRCEDPAANKIASAPVPLDGDVWAADCAEFMLLPGYDPGQPYDHFAVNPAGSLNDAKVKDKSWNSGAKGYPFEVSVLTADGAESVILTDRVRSVDWKVRRVRKIETVPDEVLHEVIGRLEALLINPDC